MIKRLITLFQSALLMLFISACASTSPGSGDHPASSSEALPDGVTEYVVLDEITEVPFIVIQADSYADDGFDLYLRDELLKVGFPRGVTRAQLGRVYLNAGLGNVAQSVDDPLAMYQLSREVGPFLLLRVSYRLGGLWTTPYTVTVWDAASSRLVFSQKRAQVVWWNFRKEIGPLVVSALAQWRNDCLVATQAKSEERMQSAIWRSGASVVHNTRNHE